MFREINLPWAWLGRVPRPYAPIDAAAARALRTWWLWGLAATVIVAAGFPSVDLAVTRIFYDGSFPWVASHGLEVLRQGLWRLTIALFLLSLLGLVCSLFGRALFQVPTRLWGFIASLYLLGPGLIVNLGLKSYWGRARPANVTEFGGTARFTPALEPASECARNCSFVSGEASGSVAFGISLWVLGRLIRNELWRLRVTQCAIALALLGSLLRVIKGRHFLSDVVFAALIVGGLALLLSLRFGLRERLL